MTAMLTSRLGVGKRRKPAERKGKWDTKEKKKRGYKQRFHLFKEEKGEKKGGGLYYNKEKERGGMKYEKRWGFLPITLAKVKKRKEFFPKGKGGGKKGERGGSERKKRWSLRGGEKKK